MRLMTLSVLTLLVAGAAGADIEDSPRLVVEMTAETIVVTKDDQGNEAVRRVTPKVLSSPYNTMPSESPIKSRSQWASRDLAIGVV